MFQVRVLDLSEVDSPVLEFKRVGADSASWGIMGPKAKHRNIKLCGLKPAEANILKQDMLSLGGDAAVSRGTINCSTKETDIVLMGSMAVFQRLMDRMTKQPMKRFARMAEEIESAIDGHKAAESGPRPAWRVDGKRMGSDRTIIMGILNVTPDSFSDGGKFNDEKKAIDHAIEMVNNGADIIDIGGESSRPFAEPVSVKEEMARTIPVIKALSREISVPISIDTYKPEVAEAALAAGASIVNDINGLRRDGMIDVVASSGASTVIMHMKGTPRDMQKNPHYDDLMGELYSFFSERVETAISAGISRDAIALDPGIGFGKTVENNYEIIRRLGELTSLGYPILVGPSRKSFIGAVLNVEPEDRLEGTLAACTASVLSGASIVRVHDVIECARSVRIADAIRTYR